jgi:hypothetical protein
MHEAVVAAIIKDSPIRKVQRKEMKESMINLKKINWLATLL